MKFSFACRKSLKVLLAFLVIILQTPSERIFQRMVEFQARLNFPTDILTESIE